MAFQRLIGIWLVASLVPSFALSCAVFVDQELEDIRLADVVVQGELISYEKVGFEQQRPLDHYGLIHLRTLETWKGEERPDWEFYWWNSTFGMPDEWRFGETFVIAGVWPGNPQPPLRGPSATILGNVRPDLIQVLQAPCSSPFIFRTEPTERELEMIASLEMRLRGLKDIQIPSIQETVDRLEESINERLPDHKLQFLRGIINN